MNVLITEAGGCYTVYMGRVEVLNFNIDTLHQIRVQYLEKDTTMTMAFSF